MRFTFRQLRYVTILATELHFGRAAERCGVTQPALSQQLALLEAECGTALFERTGRALLVTAFGAEFIARARLVLEGAEALADFAADRHGQPVQNLRLGIIPTIAPYLLPSAYPALRAGFPDYRFVITESHTDHLLTALGAGDLDLVLIATEPPPRSHFTNVALCADPFVLAAAHGGSLVEPIQLDHLPKDRILLLDEGHCFRDQAIDACALRDPHIAQTFAATSLSTIVEFVANGQGYTLLPAISLKKEAADNRVRIQRLAAPGPSRILSLAWRETTPFAPLFNEIADTIRPVAEALLASTLQ